MVPSMIRRIIFILLLLLGLAGAVAVPFWVGIDKSIEAVRHMGFLCVLTYLLNAILAYLIPAVSWYLIMRGERLGVSLIDCVRAALMGFPVSFVTPSMYLGGEPVKALYITQKYKLPGSKVVTIHPSRCQCSASSGSVACAPSPTSVSRSASTSIPRANARDTRARGSFHNAPIPKPPHRRTPTKAMRAANVTNFSLLHQ